MSHKCFRNLDLWLANICKSCYHWLDSVADNKSWCLEVPFQGKDKMRGRDYTDIGGTGEVFLTTH